MNLVIIPFHDWKKCEREGFRTRDAHFMQEFGRHPNVEKLLVINRPTSIAEMAALRRHWHVQNGKPLLKKNGVYLAQTGPKTFTLDILIWEIIKPLTMKRHWTSYIFAQTKVLQAVNTALDYLDITSSYALFLSAPLFIPLVKNLSPAVFVLDAQDNLLKHSLYHDVPELEDYYNYCQDRADLLYANSKETAVWLAEKRPDTQHIANGVDDETFSPTQAYPLPPDMAAIKHPIVGYAGKIQELFDVEMMIQAATQNPTINFVFIGQELKSDWARPLWQYSNVYYLGDKRYDLLPSYLAAFDICSIPYNIERQHGGDPIKFYEYMAMGKPIVTTNIGGVNAFRDYPQVWVSDSVADFLTDLAECAQLIQQEKPISIRPIPNSSLWRTKADNIIQAINRKMDVSLSHTQAKS